MTAGLQKCLKFDVVAVSTRSVRFTVSRIITVPVSVTGIYPEPLNINTLIVISLRANIWFSKEDKGKANKCEKKKSLKHK